MTKFLMHESEFQMDKDLPLEFVSIFLIQPDFFPSNVFQVPVVYKKDNNCKKTTMTTLLYIRPVVMQVT